MKKRNKKAIEYSQIMNKITGARSKKSELSVEQN